MAKAMKEKYIVPMTLPLDQKIESDVHFLRLPRKLKEQLIRLEEISRSESKYTNAFIREKHYLPLNSLKDIFRNYLPGVTDMKAVSANTPDDRWLISLQPIDTLLVTKLIIIWIECFYIEEELLKSKRDTKIKTRKFAQALIESFDDSLFEGCSAQDHVVLFDNGVVVDKDAYGLLPLIIVSALVGKDVIVSGKSSYWMYSRKNEIVTNPIDYESKQHRDKFSYAVQFAVQTLPPYNKPYLNAHIVSRRWVSSRETDSKVFLKNKKSVYYRMADHKLQQFQAEYRYSSKSVEWLTQDTKIFKALFGAIPMPEFEEVLQRPDQYMTETDFVDMYIPFEYGMKEENISLHSMDAGLTHRDRKEIFDNIVKNISYVSSVQGIHAYQVSLNSDIAPIMFTDEFAVLPQCKNEFYANLALMSKGEPLTIEIWYSSGQEEIRNHLQKTFQKHLAETDARINLFNLRDYAEKLECYNEKLRDNISGIQNRIQEVAEYVTETAGSAKGTTIAVVIFHNERYYGNDAKYDPKAALRYGFANTGRLTQFLTEESYKDAEIKLQKKLALPTSHKKDGSVKKAYAYNMVVRNTVLDVYRQAGMINTLSANIRIRKNTGLDEKIAVGIHVINYKKMMNKLNMDPCPVIVTCNLLTHEIRVEAAFQVQPNRGFGNTDVYEINCLYSEFPIRFHEMLRAAGADKRIRSVPSFINDWFNHLNPDKKYEVMIVADGTSRQVIEGISNKEIAVNYDTKSENIITLPVSSRNKTAINLVDYGNIDLIRIRNNVEVPDYYPEERDEKSEDNSQFARSSGLYGMEKVFYSRDASPMSEAETHNADASKLIYDKAFQHRNIIEIYPVYISDREKRLECVRDVHNLRSVAIQYEAAMTELPLPLHLGKLLEEYMI